MSHVLLIDDERDIAETLREVLESEGFDVRLAFDGRAAYELARESPPSLFVTDLMMPVVDGYQLIDLVRADERLRSIPILVVSAAPDTKLLEQRKVPVLRKPFDIDRFVTQVRSLARQGPRLAAPSRE